MIYIVHAIGTTRYKIGKTDKLEKRLAALQTGSPFPLEVIHSFEAHDETEKVIHEAFAIYRLHGEWFDLPEHVVERLKASDEKDFLRIQSANIVKRLISRFSMASKVDTDRRVREYLSGYGL